MSRVWWGKGSCWAPVDLGLRLFHVGPHKKGLRVNEVPCRPSSVVTERQGSKAQGWASQCSFRLRFESQV